MSELIVPTPKNLLSMPPLPWFSDTWDMFVRSVSSRRCSHALLLTSPSGAGADYLAFAMSQYLLCHAPSGGLVCGACRGCELNASGSHPDAKRVTLEAGAKRIKVEQIRNISDFVAKTSQQGGRKVVVISLAEWMNDNAANALLKSLEEPSGDTYFILVSEAGGRLMSTIRSRCMKLALSLPKRDLALTWLNQNLSAQSLAQYPEPELKELLIHACGAPLLVKHWIDEGLVDAQKTISETLLAVSRHQKMPIQASAECSRMEPLVVAQVMARLIESSARQFHLGGATEKNIRFESESILTRCLHFYDGLMEKKRFLAGQSNLNSSLVVERLMIDWSELWV